VRDIDLSGDLRPRHRETLRALGLLAGTVPIEEWCLVGGMMVLVAARAVGHRLPRAEQTKDGDVVVDVCTRPQALRRVATTLRNYGYDIPPDAWDDEHVARCTFVGVYAQIDVLCPDDAREEDLEADGGVRSLAIPGGRRALELAEPVRIYYEEEALDVEVRVPLLSGAMVVKAHAAIDGRTADQRRHIEDVAALLSIVDDPSVLRQRLTDDDVRTIAALAPRLADDGDAAWTGMDTATRLRGQAAARIITG
jgi:hypothetical protein